MPAIALLLLAAEPTWRSLDVGVEYATVALSPGAVLHAVRVDGTRAKLRLVMASKEGVKNRTAGEWADDVGLVVAINAGMFMTDQTSNVGYARDGTHENNPRWNEYQSVLAFGPRRPGMASLVLADRSNTFVPADYDTVVQNLRLIKGRSTSVWAANGRKWSEALAAVDQRGRLLLMFVRAPFQMSDLNRRLLALPFGIERAVHLEGGPEASLSIRAPGVRLDLMGSYETGFTENEDNVSQWPIPNVLGIVRR